MGWGSSIASAFSGGGGGGGGGITSPTSQIFNKQLDYRYATKQRRAQESYNTYMSNTAHKREMQDLYNAGLNPILSAKLGGASSPPTGMANVGPSDVLGGAQQNAARENLAKDTELKEEQKGLTSAQAHRTRVDTVIPEIKANLAAGAANTGKSILDYLSRPVSQIPTRNYTPAKSLANPTPKPQSYKSIKAGF